MIKKIKKISFKKLLKEILVFALLLLIFSNIVSYYKSQNLSHEKLPAFDATLLDGKEFNSLHANANKPLLIHFWATWCPTCKVENDTIDALSEKFEVITIAVNSGSDEQIQNFLKEKNLKFKVINDANGTLAKAFHVSAFPTTFIYNKDGSLAFSEVGYSAYISLYLKLLYAQR